MNFLAKKFLLATVVALPVLFFTSCEKIAKIGVDTDPQNNVVLTKYKEFVLPSTQVQFNPRSTVNVSLLQAGIYSDKNFGVVSSKTFAWLGVQSSTPVLHTSAAYVNTTFSIQFSSFYGSEAKNLEVQSFEIYQLADNIDKASDYTRTDEISIGALIGKIDILIKKKDTLLTDSLFTAKINDSFGKILFDKLKSNDAMFNDDASFNAFFKGIAIIAKASNNKIIKFNPTTFNIKLNYTEKNSAGQTVKRNYLLNIGTKRFYYLNSDLSMTPLVGILPNNKDFIPNDNFRYIQAGTLIALKVDYTPILDFFKNETNSNLNKIIVQKAWLSMGKINKNIPGAGAPPSLIGYFTDADNTWPTSTVTKGGERLVTLQSEFIRGNIPVYPSFYGATQGILLKTEDNSLSYEATMSNFIQNLILGRYNTKKTPFETQGKLIIFPPTSIKKSQSSPSHFQTNFFKIHKDSIRVKIYYSKTNIL